MSAFLGSALPAAAQPGADEILINFDDAELHQVINTISRLTNENFLIDPSVKGRVTVVAPRPVPKAEALQVLQSILELHGFALVPGDNVYKVVQARAAVQKDIPVCVGREPCRDYEGDQLVTQLIPLRYAEAPRMVSLLQPLASRDAPPVSYENTNTIILTDSNANLRRILGIVNQIDVAGYEENITIVPLKYASAEQIAQTIREALEPSGDGPVSPRRPRRAGQPPEATIEGRPSEVRIIPEARTNSIIIVANEPDTQQVMFLVKQLDTLAPVEQNNIHVHNLSNALATELAEVLSNLAGAQPAAAGEGGGQPGRTRTFYQEVSVVADESTNSLLIIATPQDYAVLENVINRLDVRRPQVLVEVLIAEVSADFARSLGIRWAGGIGKGDDGGFVGVNESLVGSVVDLTNVTDVGALSRALPLGLPPGASVGALVFDMDILRLYAEANANETDSDFNLLSSPNLLMLDNEEGRIVIAQSVPFVTGSLTDTGGTGLAQNQTVEFRDVGITLEVTPHIAPDRTVRLELHQEVNERGPDVVLGTGEAAATTPTEVKREVTTVVLVNDQHTIVLGGLMSDNESETINKVPLLGDVPLFGWLFKNKTRTTNKVNLMLFITPTIVSDLTESERVTQVKRDEIPAELDPQFDRLGVYQRSRTFQPPVTPPPVPESLVDPQSPTTQPEAGLIDAPVK